MNDAPESKPKPDPLAGGASGKIVKTADEWRSQLTPEQFHVTREHGTERAFSHAYNDEKGDGIFTCVCCSAPLFASNAKFDSGTGWPSYFQPIDEDAINEHEDNKLFMRRTEVRCATCEAHLGHVFPDGPKPTAQRFCINGQALKFKPQS